jgi:acetyltransferase
MGFPVVLKLHSLTITHKTDVGGVVLNLGDAEAVDKAFEEIKESVTEKVGANHFQGVTVQAMAKPNEYELILGSSIDSQFGPVLLFGAGGQLVEVFNDKALALPPLNSTLARRMMEQTKIYKALRGVRGRAPINMEALQELMVRFSELVVEQRWIKEIEINPLRVSPEHLVALDARILTHGLEVFVEELPKLAIRPYPAQYVSTWKMKDGKEVIIRPIRPEDEPLIVQFNEKLSERSIYMRYFQPIKLSQRTAHERLTRICFVDHDREIELVVERKTESGDREIIAAGRMSKLHGRNEAELAALVRDEFQANGLGTELYRRMIGIAKDEGLDKVNSVMLGENREMRSLVVKQGFKLKVDLMDDLVEAELIL